MTLKSAQVLVSALATPKPISGAQFDDRWSGGGGARGRSGNREVLGACKSFLNANKFRPIYFVLVRNKLQESRSKHEKVMNNV